MSWKFFLALAAWRSFSEACFRFRCEFLDWTLFSRFGLYIRNARVIWQIYASVENFMVISRKLTRMGMGREGVGGGGRRKGCHIGSNLESSKKCDMQFCDGLLSNQSLIVSAPTLINHPVLSVKPVDMKYGYVEVSEISITNSSKRWLRGIGFSSDPRTDHGNNFSLRRS